LDNGLFVSGHGGNNGESHNHNDVGDFIVYANGDPVIIDVGSGTYTARTFSHDRYKLWFNASAYHNLPTINGQQQQEGTQHGTSHFSWQSDAHGDFFNFDIDKAYAASLGLTSWNRIIAFSGTGITVSDNFAMKNPPDSLAQTFMTVCKTDITQPGKIIFTTQHGYKVELKYGTAWNVSKEIIPLVTEEDQGLKMTWHNQPITRVLLSLRSPKSSGSFEYVIRLLY
jgi:hypothetical protein